MCFGLFILENILLKQISCFFFEEEAGHVKYVVDRNPAVHGKILPESVVSECQDHVVSVNTERWYLELFSLGVFCFPR